jgi:hypothetical protein
LGFSVAESWGFGRTRDFMEEKEEEEEREGQFGIRP